MGYREPFSLYSRKDKGGKRIWYYRTYDKFGRRATGKSTVQTSKAAAKYHVINLIKNDSLLTKGYPTFECFAQDWWIWNTCHYIKNKLAKGHRISRDYADANRKLSVRRDTKV